MVEMERFCSLSAFDKLGGNKGSIDGAEFFSEWKVRNSLSDIAYKGPKFTWCNNRKGNKRIYERIDKGLASPLCYSVFPYSGIKHFPIQCSDHAPIIFDTGFFEPHKRKSFRMEAWAFEYEDSLRLLKQEWFLHDRGSPVTKLSRKLRRTRYVFKNWTLAKRKSWNEKWSEFDERLEAELEKKFSGHIKNRHDRNLIIGLKRADSSWTFDKQKLAGIFDDHFKEIYGVNTSRGTFQHFTRKEVRTAVFQLGSTKLPGPDGIPALFYQKF
ncbi:uncharacterized protein LOC141640438 [Silene latifolia]|uniref:uncharacterized protein LOC141640438 n=1 Tax=Silene latifolia TaxID=37657 RepID=UPI003D76ADEE